MSGLQPRAPAFSGLPRAKGRLEEFRDTKADVLITACAYCKDTFGKMMGNEAGRVQDFTEFVSDRVT